MKLGIDVGGTNLKAGVLDAQNRLLGFSTRPLEPFSVPVEILPQLLAAAEESARSAGIRLAQVDFCGVGIPGAVQGRDVRYAPNLPLQTFPLAESLARRLGAPVRLGNDADCAAMGEYICGAGRGCRNFLLVTLGTGVGCGMILNGVLYAGMGSAGEAGHMVIHPGGQPCPCGRRGCWEQYASAAALVRRTREAMDTYPGSLLHALAAESGTVDGRTAFAAAQRGDPAAQAVCRAYGDDLATGLVNLLNVLQPERAAIGGGISSAPEELLLTPLRETAARECYGRFSNLKPEIVRAELGNAAGTVGAALLERTV